MRSPRRPRPKSRRRAGDGRAPAQAHRARRGPVPPDPRAVPDAVHGSSALAREPVLHRALPRRARRHRDPHAGVVPDPRRDGRAATRSDRRCAHVGSPRASPRRRPAQPRCRCGKDRHRRAVQDVSAARRRRSRGARRPRPHVHRSHAALRAAARVAASTRTRRSGTRATWCRAAGSTARWCTTARPSK